MLTDPIADMLTRIRNAGLARHEEVKMPHSKLKESIVKVLAAEGCLVGFKTVEESGHKQLVVTLKYDDQRRPVIEKIRRVSMPGRRVYVRHDRIAKVRSGLGLAVLSTGRGVMTDAEARRLKVGGEIICEVW